MDRRTKFKVTIITIVGVLVTLVYLNREQLIREFRFAQLREEWEMEEPVGLLVDGHKNGEWKTYFKNGQLARLEEYKNDTLHGKRIWYTPDGRYNSRENYYMGIKVDSSFLYDGKGRLNVVEFRDSAGRKQGIFKVYDINGQVIQIGNYTDDKFDGEFRTFFQTGQLKSIYYYTLGNRSGKWIELSNEGDTTKVVQY